MELEKQYCEQLFAYFGLHFHPELSLDKLRAAFNRASTAASNAPRAV